MTNVKRFVEWFRERVLKILNKTGVYFAGFLLFSLIIGTFYIVGRLLRPDLPFTLQILGGGIAVWFVLVGIVTLLFSVIGLGEGLKRLWKKSQ